MSVDMTGTPIEQLLEKEWLLTNTRGGYSSSTVVGCNTRRYHGLLIGALDPPANRILALSNCLETIFLGPGVFHLGTVEFPDKILPDGYMRLKRFSRDFGAHFHYRLGELRLTKSVYLLRDEDTAAVVYEFDEVPQPIDFTIRPLVALRDFHSLQKSDAHITAKSVVDGVLIRHDSPDSCPVTFELSRRDFRRGCAMVVQFPVSGRQGKRSGLYRRPLLPRRFQVSYRFADTLVFWANLSRDYKPGRPATAGKSTTADSLSCRISNRSSDSSPYTTMR